MASRRAGRPTGDPWTTADDLPDDLEERALHLRHDTEQVYATLQALLTPPAWWRSAACRGRGPDMFFPTVGEPVDPALEVCSGCPVVAQCADAGESERFGIWGGLSGKRRKERRRSVA